MAVVVASTYVLTNEVSNSSSISKPASGVVEESRAVRWEISLNRAVPVEVVVSGVQNRVSKGKYPWQIFNTISNSD